MVTNVLVTIFYDDEWIEILHQLEIGCNWKIRYVVGLPEMEIKIRGVFTGVLFEDVGLFLTGVELAGDRIAESPEITALPEIPFEFGLLEKLSKYEFMIKYLINREYDKGQDRTNEIYFDLIKYWLRIIDHTKPSLILVPIIPYTAREYLLFALSQVLDIRFLTFRKSTIDNHLYIPVKDPTSLFINEVVAQYKSIRDEGAVSVEMCESTKQKISDLLDTNNKSHLSNSEKVLKSGIDPNTFGFISEYSLNVLNTVNTKELKTGRGVLRTVANFVLEFIKKRAAFKRFCSLKSTYDSYCVNPAFEHPYILFTLHYQPEWSTAPLGQYAVYQHLPIEMLSRSLPDNWIIYVKEHYATFSPHYQGWKKRPLGYYERIAKIPSVKFVPIEMDTSLLIDGSQAVATITGSVGVESIFRGKTVLTFGAAWYNGCDGVFPIQTYKECKEVLDSINHGVVVDPNQMLLFIQASELVGAQVNYLYSMKTVNPEGITREDTIRNMVSCISRWDALPANNNHV